MQLINSTNIKQEITPEAFAQFLAQLASNSEQAGEEYEILRQMLVKFFECRGQAFADDLTDEVFNRVIRRVAEGEKIDNISGYCYSIARFILLEQSRSPERRRVDLEDLSPLLSADTDEEDDEERLDWLRHCLNSLSGENRALMLEYYQDERRGKIDVRQQMAAKLGVSRNALANRMLRLRDKIEKCVRRSLKKNAISPTQIRKH